MEKSTRDYPPVGPNHPRRRLIFGVVVTVAIFGIVISVSLKFHRDVKARKLAERTKGIVTVNNGTILPIAQPAKATSLFKNTHPSVNYVGTSRCKECHADVHESFSATIHHHSMSKVKADGEPPPGIVRHVTSGRSYRIEWDKGRLWHHETLLAGNQPALKLASHAMAYQVGSGHVARSYLLDDDGFLVQSPITWFSKRKKWDMSPGYDQPNHASFLRVVNRGCVYCHTGRVEPVDASPFRYRIVETTIGCERCHGPGELHVKLRSNPNKEVEEIDHTIVNPHHLPRELAEAICNQCHLQGDFQVVPRGSRAEDFRPGLPLRDYRLEFRNEHTEDRLKIAGHVEQLHLSQCHQKSKTLTCTTCHETHRKLDPEKKIAHFRNLCTNCHNEQSCVVPRRKRVLANNNDCTACHMPPVETEVQHVALTHHRIGLHTKLPVGNNRSNGLLKAMQDLSHLQEVDRQRAFGMAYLMKVTQAVPDPVGTLQFQLAFKMLHTAHKNGARDAATLVALAEIYRITGELRRAVEFAGDAVKLKLISPRTRFDALEILAEAHDRLGKPQQAIAALRELAKHGRSALHFYVLALSEHRLGNRDQAISAMQKAIHIDPGESRFHRAIVPMLRERGDTKQSQWHQRRATELSHEPLENGSFGKTTGDEDCSSTDQTLSRQRTRDPP